MINKFQKGKHIYTKWGNKTEQVTVVREKKKEEKVTGQLKVEVPEAMAGGVNADLFAIHSNGDEFIIDSCKSMQGNRGVKLVSRVITNPEHAKKFFHALKKAIEG